MPKSIPIEFAAHKAGQLITTSYLLKIGPLRDGSYLRMTSLNRNERYDALDGLGEQSWYAASGIELSTLEATNDLTVDNGEARSLIPVYPTPGITQAMVDRGDLDGARWIVYEHNYLSSAAGKHEIFGGGKLGACRVVQGLLVIPELRAWTQLLKQNGLVGKTSLLCRSIWGSQPLGTGGGVEEELFPCRYDASGEWVDFTIDALGDEVVREFYSADLTQATDYFQFGQVRMEDGANAGQTRELESFTSVGGAGFVSLRFTFREPLAIGDHGKIRRGCSKRWAGHNSCDTYGNRPWFNGEPNIPIGDSIAIGVPGVNVVHSTGGTGEAML
jgi:hypothetical protein